MSGECPCGSGRVFMGCCGPFLDGELAPTPEALMRSRFTAFVVGNEDHLFRTWHPSTRPEPPFCSPDIRWVRLQILDAPEPCGDVGVAEFIASFVGSDGRSGQMREVSRFQRRGGRWVYVDGQVS